MKYFATLLLGLSLLTQAVAEDELPPYPRVEVSTSLGDFTIEMYTSRAPLTVRNFLDYVDAGFYTNTIFHRVIENFVVQGGGYDVDYKLKETRPSVVNESGNGLTNRRGFVGMARTGEPHSADSQFYVNLRDNPALDPRITRWGYTVFGQVVEGIEVIDEMAGRSTTRGPIPQLPKDVPAEQIVILGIKRVADGDAKTPDGS